MFLIAHFSLFVKFYLILRGKGDFLLDPDCTLEIGLQGTDWKHEHPLCVR